LEPSQNIILIVSLAIFYIILPYYLAKRKGRDPLKFIFLGFLFSICVWIYLILCKSEPKESGELDLYDAIKSLNGMSEKKARLVIEKYPNILALSEATVDGLEEIPGIGKKLAEALKQKFG